MTPPNTATVLKELVGRSLRAVVFVNDDYVPVYRRDDVSDDYSPEELEEIHDELHASGLASPYLGELWRLGEHDCTVYIFSEGLVCHVIGDTEELVVSMDLDQEEIDLMAVIQECSRLLGDEA